MREALGAGYLGRVEANLLSVQPAPGAVFVRLSRTFSAEGQTSSMFTEMTPDQVLRLIDVLREAVRAALGPTDQAELATRPR